MGTVEIADTDRVVQVASLQQQEVPSTSLRQADSAIQETPEISVDERRELCQLIREYSDIFAKGQHDLGLTRVIRHSIPTTSEQPLYQRPYRQPYHLRAETSRQVQEMGDANIITQSSSPWSSPVILVPKKDGSSRFCVDFRRLNEVTVRDAYPIPRIDETLDSLGGARYFTTLDLASGYWQVELDPQDRAKTAFSTMDGHYEFPVMPFGLTNAPLHFNGSWI